MKRYIKNIALLAVAALGFAACEDYPDAFVAADGVPTVHYVRYADNDQLIEQAYMGEIVCLVGDNLCSVHELLFNDKPAILNTSYMTEHTLVAAIPNELSANPTDKVYMVTHNQDTVSFDFRVMLPLPVIKSMSCEMQPAGEEVTVYGNYFAEPLTIEFANTTVTDIKSLSMTEVTFVIPEGTEPGKLKITTESGVSQSPFMYMDNRGLITDFEGPAGAGSNGITPKGWNFSGTFPDGGITGKYLQLKSDKPLSADAAWDENFKIDYWCGVWNGDPMGVKEGAGAPICNIIDFTDFANMSLKFELCVPSDAPWKAGAMQLIFASAARAANEEWQNNTFMQSSANDAKGLDLCRGFYRPWEATGSFDTGGKWITVTVPFSEFTYNADGTPGKVPLSKPEDFASFVIYVWSGGLNGEECNPVFKIDNIRAVPNK